LFAAHQSLRESYPATPESVPLIRHAVTDYAKAVGVAEHRLDDVRLAVSEAVTNVVLHAYRDGPGEVHVAARAVGGELWVLVADSGCGPHTPARSPGVGWGLALITAASDEFTLLERAEGGTEARMLFRTATEESTAASSLRPADP
jgi:anti-sigma regulatory factor (Ser/Thr protein kinase)